MIRLSDEEIERRAKLLIRQNATGIADELPPHATPDDMRENDRLKAAIALLRREGYSPPPLPELTEPDQVGNALRFWTRDATMMARAITAHTNQSIDSWVYFDGEDDQVVEGRVVNIQPEHDWLWFDILPDED